MRRFNLVYYHYHIFLCMIILVANRPVASLEIRKEWEGYHDDLVSALSFNAGQEMLASASWDGTIKIWNVSNGILKNSIKPVEGSAYINSFTFCCPDDRGVYGTNEGFLGLISINDSSLLMRKGGFEDPRDFSLICSRKKIVVRESNGISIIDPSTLEVIRRPETRGDISAFAVSTDGKTLAFARFSGWMTITSIATKDKCETKVWTNSTVMSLEFAPDDCSLIGVTEGGSLFIVDLLSFHMTGKILPIIGDIVSIGALGDHMTGKILPITGRVVNIGALGDKKTLMVVTSSRGFLRYQSRISFYGMNQLRQALTEETLDGRITAVSLSPKRNLIATAIGGILGNNNKIILWRIQRE